MRTAAATFALLILAAACSGDGNGEPTLQPASQARSTLTARAGGTASSQARDLGQPATVGDLTITPRTATYLTIAEMDNRSPSGPGAEWILVNVRIENRGKRDAGADFNIVCPGGARAPRYAYNAPGALDPASPLPPATFAEGDMLFSMPASCKGAGILSAEAAGAFVGEPPPPATWRLP